MKLIIIYVNGYSKGQPIDIDLLFAMNIHPQESKGIFSGVIPKACPKFFQIIFQRLDVWRSFFAYSYASIEATN